MNDPTIVTDDGVSLEAVLTTTGDARGAIVLCHPHPQHGGTMRAPILEAITLEAARRGFDILRFNFRGIGRSTGSHGFGNDEIADVDGAVTWMTQRTVPVVEGDTPETLAARVLEQEHSLLVETIARIASGDLALPAGTEG